MQRKATSLLLSCIVSLVMCSSMSNAMNAEKTTQKPDYSQQESWASRPCLISHPVKAGVPTELHVNPGAFHGFDSFVPEAGISQRFKSERDTVLKRVLHRQHKGEGLNTPGSGHGNQLI